MDQAEKTAIKRALEDRGFTLKKAALDGGFSGDSGRAALHRPEQFPGVLQHMAHIIETKPPLSGGR